MDHSKHLANIMDEGGDMCEKISGFQDLLCNIQYHFSLSDEAQKVFLISIVLAKNGSAKSTENPIDDLHEWDDAEAKTKTKEAAKGGNEIHRTHSDTPLHF